MAQVAQANPTSPILWRDYAAVALAQGALEEANSAAGTAIQLAPEDAEAVLIRGLALQATGQTDEALDDLTTATELNPTNREAWLRRGALLVALGRPAEAIPNHQREVGLAPNDPDAWLRLGTAQFLAGDIEAETNIRHALQLDPSNASAWLNLGILLRRERRYPDAIEALNTALASLPEDAGAWYQKALTLKAMHHRRDALKAWRRARDLSDKPLPALAWRVGWLTSRLPLTSPLWPLSPSTVHELNRPGFSGGYFLV